jgi:tetratricopeptide (TPR) repeat protein
MGAAAGLAADSGASPAGGPPDEPSITDLLARDRVASASEALERRVAVRPGDGEAWVALAAIDLSRHDFARSLERLARARGATPAPAGRDYLRGIALLRFNRPEEAAEAFLAALDADPDDWAAAMHLAIHHRRAGRSLSEEVLLEHALLHLEEGRPRAPDHGPAAALVDSVHRDPAAARRAAATRLDELAAAHRGR